MFPAASCSNGMMHCAVYGNDIRPFPLALQVIIRDFWGARAGSASALRFADDNFIIT
jgi:hypothetical protein